MKILKSWLPATIIASTLFLLVRPVLAQTIETPKINFVGTENVDGYMQVFYENEKGRYFITSGNLNHKTPVFAGNFISYVTEVNGEGQVFLFDLTGGVNTQITFISTNLNPKVNDKGQVVWEGWSYQDSTWQIFFFDGTSTKQLTTGDTSLNPEIEGEYVSYGRRDITGTWRAVIYSIADNKSVDVITGENARKPRIKNEDIYLGDGTEKFPLKVSDLFLLDFQSINESTSSGDPIIEELSATPSGVVEISI